MQQWPQKIKLDLVTSVSPYLIQQRKTKKDVEDLNNVMKITPNVHPNRLM